MAAILQVVPVSEGSEGVHDGLTLTASQIARLALKPKLTLTNENVLDGSVSEPESRSSPVLKNNGPKISKTWPSVLLKAKDKGVSRLSPAVQPPSAPRRLISQLHSFQRAARLRVPQLLPSVITKSTTPRLSKPPTSRVAEAYINAPLLGAHLHPFRPRMISTLTSISILWYGRIICPVEGCPSSEGGHIFERMKDDSPPQSMMYLPGYVRPFCPDRPQVFKAGSITAVSLPTENLGVAQY